jgi:hypothetical protein
VSDIHIQQMPAFKKAYKKLPFSQQLIVNNAIKAIIKNPCIFRDKWISDSERCGSLDFNQRLI